MPNARSQIFETAGGAQKDYQQAQTDLVAAQATARTAAAALGAARDKLAILGKSPGEIGALERVQAKCRGFTTVPRCTRRSPG